MRQIAALAFAACVCAPLALQAASQDFSLINRTGSQIDSVYVTETGRRDWGNDVMGRGSLKNGERASVTFDRGTMACRWDLRVRYHDATEMVWTAVDLCTAKRLALVRDRNTQTTAIRAE